MKTLRVKIPETSSSTVTWSTSLGRREVVAANESNKLRPPHALDETTNESMSSSNSK